jgi:iron complex outermembrane receptor protein
MFIVPALGAPAAAQSLEQLQNMSIEDLGNLNVTSVSKRPESLSDAAAAIYVITHDDIMRSGATSIPEILRLAPNLQVTETSPANYIVTARGFNGNSQAQSFSDKLLVLVDGRSVYNPLFSGVYWDTIDVLPDNIERIEVISGPGATLWGANAVNGVINITTKKASDTQGVLVIAAAGSNYKDVAVQYGGTIGADVAYRIFGKAFYQNAFETAAHASAHDAWYKPQAGFRIDWTPDKDSVSVSGDIYGGTEHQGGSDQIVSGGNLTTTWQHPMDDGSTLQVLGYFDVVHRGTSSSSGSFTVRTYDIEVQDSITIDARNKLVVGAGDRVNDYNIVDEIGPVTSLLFAPSSRTLNLADFFLQDDYAITDSLTLTVGIKIENDPYSGWAPMPTARASWRMDDDNMVWAAISRAVRSPTPFDVDVIEKIGAATFLNGNPNFEPEELTAYEAGYRGQFGKNASLSVSGFYNVYNDLRSIEFSPGPGIIEWGNKMRGDVYGVDIWGAYQPTDWWRLNAGLHLQHEDLRFAPGSTGLLGVAQQGDDPHLQATLRSSMNLSDAITFDADLRYVGTLPNPKVPDYVELNATVGWRLTDQIELALSGFNLLHARHVEYAPGDEIPRSVLLETRLRL